MPRKVTNSDFIKKSILKHGNRYDYSDVVIINAAQKVNIICKEHGVFEQTPTNHMQGRGCPKCARAADKTSLDEFISRSNQKHKKFYDYSLIKQLFGLNKKYKIICPLHGIFEQRAADHLNGFGCVKCKAANLSKQKTTSKQKRISQLTSIHNNYQFIIDNDTKVHNKIEVICPIHGSFHATIGNLLHQSSGCPSCSRTTSNAETELYDFIKSIYRGEIIRQDKKIISPNQLDIVLPQANLALEYNGMFWHSDIQPRINRKYHQQKTIRCNEIGYQLIHVFENMWVEKQPIIKDIIRKRLAIVENIFYARECKLIKLDNSQAKQFFNDNHIQSSGGGAIVTYGLLSDKQLISAMSFCKNRFGGNEQYELLRFANKLQTITIGGASKMFKRFVEEFAPTSIVTYSDASLFSGKLYSQIGFKFESITEPNYVYWSNSDQKTLSRYQCQKHKLPDLLVDGFDPTQTEYQNMSNNYFYRVWNSGNYKFTWRSNG